MNAPHSRLDPRELLYLVSKGGSITAAVDIVITCELAGFVVDGLTVLRLPGDSPSSLEARYREAVIVDMESKL